jgi:ABC-2 type transport system ATP-binding protein
MSLPALAVERLSHSFGPRKVLDDVSFSVMPGDFTVLLGPNGAGKTTLIALITRLYHCKTGRISVLGNDMWRHPSAALAKIGVVFQQSTLDLDLTVGQNLYYHTALHGMARRQAKARIEAELARINMLDRLNDKARELSGGQRRRVELARALLHEPAFLLLDEPTAGLDIETRPLLLEHVRRLCAERQLAALWTTHLIEEAGSDAKVVVLNQGKILADGPVAAVVASTGAGDLHGAFDHLTKSAATARAAA